jgi:hypothetical protein
MAIAEAAESKANVSCEQEKGGRRGREATALSASVVVARPPG